VEYGNDCGSTGVVLWSYRLPHAVAVENHAQQQSSLEGVIVQPVEADVQPELVQFSTLNSVLVRSVLSTANKVSVQDFDVLDPRTAEFVPDVLLMPRKVWRNLAQSEARYRRPERLIRPAELKDVLARHSDIGDYDKPDQVCNDTSMSRIRGHLGEQKASGPAQDQSHSGTKRRRESGGLKEGCGPRRNKSRRVEREEVVTSSIEEVSATNTAGEAASGLKRAICERKDYCLCWTASVMEELEYGEFGETKGAVNFRCCGGNGR
jgi:hypothetical protein